SELATKLGVLLLGLAARLELGGLVELAGYVLAFCSRHRPAGCPGSGDDLLGLFEKRLLGCDGHDDVLHSRSRNERTEGMERQSPLAEMRHAVTHLLGGRFFRRSTRFVVTSPATVRRDFSSSTPPGYDWDGDSV